MANESKLSEALACANRGWSVFPLHNIRGGKCTCGKPNCDNIGKHPRYDYGMVEHGVLDATTDQDTIKRWWSKWPKANIGIATGDKSGIVVVDIDPRHGGDESWKSVEQKYGHIDTVQSLTGGGGSHLFFRYPADHKVGNGANIAGYEGVDIRGNGGYVVGPTSDHASGKSYEWELLSHPDESDIADLPMWIIAAAANGTKRTTQKTNLIPEGARNDTLAKLAGTMRRKGMTQASITAALLEENETRCAIPLPENDVRKIAVSISRYAPEPDEVDYLTSLTNEDLSDNADTSDYSDNFDIIDKPDKLTRGKFIWNLVDQWMPNHAGEKFDLDTICRHLDIKNRADRHHVVKKLSYEVSRKNLEKSDRLYRYINKDFVNIDWVNASPAPPLRIKWPYGVKDNSKFGFDGHVTISPGDVIVLAGVSNTGKTGFCLNLLWNNMDRYPCTLMGNEYEAGKFKRRISSMDWANPLKDDGAPKFELIERYENWQDIIRPDNINIIDWINLGDNFYSVGKIIESIKTKLNDGIAVIVIQKTEGKALGMGGSFSQHLASLYLAIDFGRMTVVKAKEWYEDDPNNRMWGFNITKNGVLFSRIREVMKCKSCNGSGRTQKGECGFCEGLGYF